MILSFHSFRAVTIEKLLKEIKKEKQTNKQKSQAESAMIRSFLL